MATTLGGAIRALLATALPTVPVTQDEPASKTTTVYPYVTVREGIASSRNTADGRGVVRTSELVQIDLWQSRDNGSEDNSLVATIERTLENAGSVNLSPNGMAFRFYPASSVRLFDPKSRVVHDALTVRVARQL